jgi:hypothetical protein
MESFDLMKKSAFEPLKFNLTTFPHIWGLFNLSQLDHINQIITLTVIIISDAYYNKAQRTEKMFSF